MKVRAAAGRSSSPLYPDRRELMPSLRADYPAIRRVLPAPSGRIDQPVAHCVEFHALLRAYLERVMPSSSVVAILGRLQDAGFATADALARAEAGEIEQVCGLPSAQLARWFGPLRRLTQWIVQAGGMEALEPMSIDTLRDAWRAIPGLGPTSVDALLLAGLSRPAYPLDRATYRILVRHGWLDGTEPYDEARAFIESSVPASPPALGEFAAAMESIGRTHCRIRAPQCDTCVLSDWLPPGGPLGAFDPE